ncbi:MAG: sodium:calcium antiporter [Sphingomonadales bacterium]
MSANSLVPIFFMVAAVPLAAIGGDLFLKGVLGIAAWSRVPRVLVGTTLAAFATSSPELTLSTVAALSGQPEIGLGDALGSNVVNIALILGLSLLFGALPASLRGLRREYLMAAAAPVATLALCLDGTVSRLDGAILLVLFFVWLSLSIRHGLEFRRGAGTETQDGVVLLPALARGAIGLAILILAGKLFVDGASGVAAALGLHAYVVGATIVAIGTSMPELVATLLTRLRGQHDLSLGILLGSSLFNGLAIVGIASGIQPIHAPRAEVAAALLFGLAALLLVVPRRDVIPRGRSLLLLALYASYAIVMASV